MIKDLTSLGLKVRNGCVSILDQELLPHQEVWIDVTSPEMMASCIKRLKVRGAPLIGVAAGLSLAQYAKSSSVGADELIRAAKLLREARPTAVNLMAAVDRIVLNHPSADLTASAIIKRAVEFFEEDVRLCEDIGNEGAQYLQDGDGVLTHCNAGGLATAGIGTAIGVIRRAFELKKKIHVYVDETRPLLQGARLTAWELEKLKIPYTLICDNMAGFLMKQGKINRIVVGADRIARNGDFANKVGTYSLAVLAHHHKIPLYVAAPPTTVDESCPSGEHIPIEERGAEEVRREFSPVTARVFNPAFDVTPRKLVAEYIGCRPGF